MFSTIFNHDVIAMIGQGIWQTLYVTVASAAVSYLIGLPLGIVLVITGKGGIKPNPAVNSALGTIVNLLRSVPFLILLIAILPITRFIVGTTLGPTASIVPLVISAFPFVARLVESSINEVDNGIVEAAQSMGATTFQIIRKVLIPEAVPSLALGCATATIAIVGYYAMAGVIGGGGLGDIAIRYGYYRYENDVMFVTVVLLIIIVQVFQAVGDKVTKVTDNR